MNKIISTICIFIIFFAYAGKNDKMSIEERRAKAYEFRMRKTGGMISRPDIQKGKVVVFNTQTNVSHSIFQKTLELTFSLMRVAYEVKDVNEQVNVVNAAEVLKKHKTSIGVFILDDNKQSTSMLVAPEEGWAFVNIAALRKDNPAKQYLNARANKELVRAILYICGGASSMYEGSLMRPIKSVKDLDDIVNTNPPIDVIGRTVRYLPEYGISTSPKVTYRKACQEGWAPAPTNKYQKAIWDEVHSSPKNPMKIKFDPKKRR